VRFTLHYEGPLPSKGSAIDKLRIREALEPQIRELWTLEPLVHSEDSILRFQESDADLSALVERSGHVFATVVSERMGLCAELDILMLRAAAPGEIIVHGGDIDNRLKTLFDALSAPAQANQIPASMRPTTEDAPMYVLLSDDRLITRVNVETERLLGPVSPTHTHLTIRVTVRVARSMFGNFGWGS
jgi:hypothetical protein